jgi:hypothetical protein
MLLLGVPAPPQAVKTSAIGTWTCAASAARCWVSICTYDTVFGDWF